MDTEIRSLIRLMTWLSPAFPVGGFAYSGGLERAVHGRLVPDAEALQIWLETLLTHGAWWNDAVLLTEAWHAHNDLERISHVTALAQALAGSAERHLEITAQGEAFMDAAGAWPHAVLGFLSRHPPYAVAVGAIAAAHDVACESTVAALLNALASQAVSSAIRLGVLGQRQGVTTLARLETIVLRVAQLAAQSSLDDLGSATMIADLSSILHETQHSRLFRS